MQKPLVFKITGFFIFEKEKLQNKILDVFILQIQCFACVPNKTYTMFNTAFQALT